MARIGEIEANYELGQLIRQRREQRHLTQQYIEDQLGAPKRAHLSRIENGKVGMSPIVARRVLGLLDIPLSELPRFGVKLEGAPVEAVRAPESSYPVGVVEQIHSEITGSPRHYVGYSYLAWGDWLLHNPIAVRVAQESLRPELLPDDIAIIWRKEIGELEPGDLVLVERENTGHHLFGQIREGGLVRLAEVTFPLAGVRLIGVVVQIHRSLR